MTRIALIGFGEVGAILADDLSGACAGLAVWDVQFSSAKSKPSASAASRALRKAAGAEDAARGADLVISAVTAAQTVEAARSVAPFIREGAFFIDLNSASPGAKQEAASLINAAGGRYVEAAVMSPMAARRIASPMLLGGPHAQTWTAQARVLGFSGVVMFAHEYGKAAAAKLCRSVIVKGVEALLTESLLAARFHGVEAAVLDSLDDLLPGPHWPMLARYMIARSVEHGARRAEEMREAARTVEEAGLRPLMSEAIAQHQGDAPRLTASLSETDFSAMLDAMRAILLGSKP